MPRESNFYTEPSYGIAPKQKGSLYVSPPIDFIQSDNQETIAQEPEDSRGQALRESMQKHTAGGYDPVSSYVPKIMAEGVFGKMPDWEKTSKLQKADVMARRTYEKLHGRPYSEYEEAGYWEQRAMDISGIAKPVGKLAKGFGKILAQTPKYVGNSVLYGINTGYNLATGAVGMITGEEYAKRTQTLTGEAGDPLQKYKELEELFESQGISKGWAKTWAGVGTVGDIADKISMGWIGASLAGTVGRIGKRIAQNPKDLVKIQRVTGKDFQPLKVDQLNEIDASQKATKEIIRKEALEFGRLQDTPDILYKRMTNSQAKDWGGNSNNMRYKFTAIGEGQIEMSIVSKPKNLKETTIDKFKEKFGDSKIVMGESGPEIKMYSEIIEHDVEGFLTSPKGFLLEPPVAKTLPKISKGIDIEPKVKPLLAEEIKMAEPPVYLMKRPMLGEANKIVENDHVHSVVGLAGDRGMKPVMIQTISHLETGKNNIYELTQKELFKVSEIIRSFPSTKNKAMPFDKSRLSPELFFTLNRSWMDGWQYEMSLKGIYNGTGDIRIMMENAVRLRQNYEKSWVKTLNEDVFGKYAKDEFVEHRRLVGEYMQGNDIITKNKLLTEIEKKELAEIGEYGKKIVKDSWDSKVLGITYTRFYEHYFSKIKKAGGINLLYKEAEMPTELKLFAEYERKGHFNVLEDDALVILQIYKSMEAKKLFMAKPYEKSMKIMATLPPNIKKATGDVVQEVMGRSDDWTKAGNDMVKSMNKKMSKWGLGKLMPENLFQQGTSLIMNIMYANALGFPRALPLARNFISQGVMLPVAEFGFDYFLSAAKWVNKKGFKELIDRGFDVKGGVMYGKEISERLGKGSIGKTVDQYKKINELRLLTEAYPDITLRLATYGAVIDRFTLNWKSFEKGKMSLEKFYKNIDMQSFSPVVKNSLEKLFKINTDKSLFEAQELMVKEVIDRIQFGYRKGSGARFHHGLRGKMFGQFSMYNFGYATTLHEWAKRGQWDKLVRWWGMTTVIRDSFEDTMGVDASKWVGLGPIGLPISPVAQMAMLATEGVNNAIIGMRGELNKNWNQLKNVMGTLLNPFSGGVGGKRIRKGLDAMERYEKSPFPAISDDPGEVFIIKAESGKAIDTVDFTDLMLYMGSFNTMKTKEHFDVLESLNTYEIEKKKKINKAMDAFVMGDFEEYNKIIIDNKLNFDPLSRLDSYQRSIIRRVYERKSVEDKIKFYPLVAPIIYGQ